MCLPAADEGDEIAGQMLSRLVQRVGLCAQSASMTALASEMLDLVEKGQADIVCISALPPAAVAHARYLCKRLTARFPELKVIIGLWTAKVDFSKARDRVGCGASIQVVSTLADAVQQITQLVQLSPSSLPRRP